MAEQVSVERPALFVSAMLARPSRAWMQPCLLLAWNEGQLALRRRGGLGPEDSKAVHDLRIGAAALDDHGSATFVMRWTVTGARLPFGRLDGRLTVAPIDHAASPTGPAVLSFAGAYRGVAAPDDFASAQTPAERAVRCLLGRLRAILTSADAAHPGPLRG